MHMRKRKEGSEEMGEKREFLTLLFSFPLSLSFLPIVYKIYDHTHNYLFFTIGKKGQGVTENSISEKIKKWER